MSRTKIERRKLGERIDWLISRNKHDPSFMGPTAERCEKIDERKRLLDAVKEFVAEGGKPALSSWNGYLNGSRPLQQPEKEAISAIYHGVPEEFFSIQDSEWPALKSRMERAADRLKYGTEKVELSRNSVALFSKRFHSEVDECPEYALIAKSGWILNTPLELSADDRDHSVYEGIPDVSASGENVVVGGYAMLKRDRADEEIAKRMHNGPTYRVMDIAQGKNGAPRFLFSRGSYYNFLDTCEVSGALFGSEMGSNASDNLPPSKIGNFTPEDIFRFWTRSAPLGVNCLTILKNYVPRKVGLAKGDYFLMHQRGKNVIEAQNVWHVVPAGGHGPSRAGPDGQDRSAVWWTVVREFLEECFNRKELQDFRKDGADFFDQKDIVPYLDGIFRTDGVAKVFLLGVGIDPVNRKPEAMVAIVIDWDKARERMNSLRNHKSAFALKLIENYEGTIEEVPLHDAGCLLEKAISIGEYQVQPAGATCLSLAAKSFDIIFNCLASSRVGFDPTVPRNVVG